MKILIFFYALTGIYLIRDVPEFIKEVSGGEVIPALRLDGLDDDSGHWHLLLVPGVHKLLHHGQASCLFLSILLPEFFQRVLEPGEVGDGPVGRREVDLHLPFGVSQAQATCSRIVDA